MIRLYWFVAEDAGELISISTSSTPLLIQTEVHIFIMAGFYLQEYSECFYFQSTTGHYFKV